MDIRLREVGAKRRLNGTSKVNRQTDGQTDGRTLRLIESIGPEGRCFENFIYVKQRLLVKPSFYSKLAVTFKFYYELRLEL